MAHLDLPECGAMTRPLLIAPLVLLLLAAPAAAESPGPLRPADADGKLGHERLSDERTLTRVAYPARIRPIRSGPGKRFRTVGRLTFLTEDRVPELYLVLRSTRDAQGHVWLQIRVPRRPNGSKGWVSREAMGPLRIRTTALEVDQGALKARLFDKGREVWTASIGVGAPSTPTPNGRYWIRERLRNLGGNAAYGPLAFGTAAYSRLSDWPGGGVIGLHGTNAPGLIPGRPSHGCIRVRNDKILALDRLMPVGTPLWIHD
jgi:L,D-transpeptidase catalytic domain